MRITSLAVLPLVLCSLVCAQEPSEFPSTSGNTYLRQCSVIEKDAKDLVQGDMKWVAACIAYTEGVVQGVNAEDSFQTMTTGRKPASPFCIPDAADNGQIIRITLKYIRNNPEEGHKTTSVIIVEALRDAFPCPVQHPAKKQ